jgi:hypothetical protein
MRSLKPSTKAAMRTLRPKGEVSVERRMKRPEAGIGGP